MKLPDIFLPHRISKHRYYVETWYKKRDAIFHSIVVYQGSEQSTDLGLICLKATYVHLWDPCTNAQAHKSVLWYIKILLLEFILVPVEFLPEKYLYSSLQQITSQWVYGCHACDELNVFANCFSGRQTFSLQQHEYFITWNNGGVLHGSIFGCTFGIRKTNDNLDLK